jgi:tetratricopeptide (TPR) repeat protein
MHSGERRGFSRRPCLRAAALLVTYLAVALPGAAARADANADAAAPALARGSELLAKGEYAAAREAFDEALAADPDSVDAHLGLARAYHALGEYSRAVLEFEAVLRFDNLPLDQLDRSAAYDQVAKDYAAGRAWRAFYYAETGIGNYRENSSSATDIFGGAGDHDTFWPLRVGGGGNTDVGERHSFNTTLDYRFRWYDDSDRRNDSDLRWNFNLSRPIDDDSLRFGMRGRVSYRGDGQHRNDWGVFATYGLGFGPNDRLTFGGEVRERRYPRGPLRERTRDIAELTGSWTHSLANGRTALTFGANFGQEWATQDRPDGDATFWGVNGEIDHSFTDGIDAFFWWSYINEAYDDERPDFTTDPDLLAARNDDLWNFGGGVVWGFASGWSLRPTFEYNWETSNIPELAYSSTELWLTVRKSF